MSAFSQYVSALLLADQANDVWTRPAEWLTLPTLADTDDRTVILYRVEDGGYNTVALNAQGNYTVDWGDGSTPENFASGVQAEHTYTYDDADLLASEMSDGAQQAIISITPQATYSITKLQLHVRPAAAPYGYYASGIMDVSVSAPSMTVFRFGRTDAGTSILLVDFPHLRQCSLYMPAITDMTYMMQRLVSLRKIPRWVVGTGLTNATKMLYSCSSLQSLPAGMTLSAVTNATYMLSGCSSLQSLPAGMTLASVTNATQMLSGCSSLQSLPAGMTLGAVTAASGMLSDCSSLQSLPAGMTLGAVTDASGMFYDCSSLQSLPAGMTLASVINAGYMLANCTSLQSLPAGMTLASVTNASYMFYSSTSLQSLPAGMTLGAATDASYMFYSCTSLQSLPAGMTLAACTTTTSAFSGCTSLQAADGLAIPQSFSIASCNFGAAALDALYTALPTVTGKTITVTGNPGTSGDDPSIATAKGWTVAGS